MVRKATPSLIKGPFIADAALETAPNRLLVQLRQRPPSDASDMFRRPYLDMVAKRNGLDKHTASVDASVFDPAA